MISFPIVKRKTKTWVIVGYLTFSLILVIQASHILYSTKGDIAKVINESSYEFPIGILGIAIFGLLIIHFLDIKRFYKIGIIVFDNKSVKIRTNNKTNTYSIFDLQKPHIKVFGYSGQQITGGVPPKEGFAGMTTSDGYSQLEGHENTFSILNHNTNLNFFIKNRTEAENLKQVLAHWRSQIDIRLSIIR